MHRQLLLFCLSWFLAFLVQQFHVTQASTTSDDDQWNNCRISAKDAESGPWTATLRVLLKDGNIRYIMGTILNPYTILTYAAGFFTGNGCYDRRNLQIYPPSNYTVGVAVGSQFSQTAEVLYIKPHPGFRGDREYWMTSQNDFVLIHLKTPLTLSKTVRPICLPKVASPDELHSIYLQPNTTAIIGGWSKMFPRPIPLFPRLYTTTHISIADNTTCETEWTTEEETQRFPYLSRACGFVTKNGEGNPNNACIGEDSGVHARIGDQLYYIGYVSNYYSNDRICNAGSRFIVSLATFEVLDWVHKGIACGPMQYACDDGQCIDPELVCNRSPDCKDGSDENPTYCRALNFCDVLHEFECGVYGDCIPLHVEGKPRKNCDGIRDCPNGEDEEPPVCPESRVSVQTTIPSHLIALIVGISVVLLLVLIVSTFLIARKRNVRDLTADEIKEFIYGTTNSVDTVETSANDENGDDEILDVKKMPYDPKYEYPREDCKLGATIGTGSFGIVKVGILNGEQVAVKIPKYSIEVGQLKALLVELKFLLFVNNLGGHENIIKILGAHTKDIRKRVLQIAVEYCQHGSLESYLKTTRSYFMPNLHSTSTAITTLRGNGSGYVCSNALLGYTKGDLHHWADQVANAMAFLATHWIVHGDLACRNILLASTHTIKVCDFGLAHQLYNYGGYSPQTIAPIPWRWMPVEVLDQNVFHRKSDVWSFGIVLWEIFNLGSEPWAGMVYNPIFVQELKAGQRLYQPEHANDLIYTTMKRCWSLHPEDRPSFQEILDSQCLNVAT